MSTQDPGSNSSPIFDALADRAPIDPLEDVALSDAVPAATEGADAGSAAASTSADGSAEPPDAAARDAAKREEAGPVDDALSDAEFSFITRGVTAEEKAAVIAVLTRVRAEESSRAKRIERREHRPWARSQRVPEGLSALVADA